MNTLVVTNLIMALAISTTTHIPTACPDNNPGCLVYHTKPSTSTEYIPAKVPKNSKGIGFSFLAIRTELIKRFGSLDALPDLIPIYFVYIKDDNTIIYPPSGVHPCGFIHKDAFLSIEPIYTLNQSEKPSYIHTNSVPLIPSLIP